MRIFSPAASFRAYAAAGPAGRAHRPFRFRLSVRQLASPSYFSPQPARSEDGVCVFPPLRVHQISIIKSASPNYAFCEKPTRSGGGRFFFTPLARLRRASGPWGCGCEQTVSSAARESKVARGAPQQQLFLRPVVCCAGYFIIHRPGPDPRVRGPLSAAVTSS